MKLVGYFVVGEGVNGNLYYGDRFVCVTTASSTMAYWENRGYVCVEVYCKE